MALLDYNDINKANLYADLINDKNDLEYFYLKAEIMINEGLHEDEADKSSGKDGEDTAGTRDEPQKDVPENRPETEKTAAAGDNPPAGNTAGRQGGGKTLPGK